MLSSKRGSSAHWRSGFSVMPLLLNVWQKFKELPKPMRLALLNNVSHKYGWHGPEQCWIYRHRSNKATAYLTCRGHGTCIIWSGNSWILFEVHVLSDLICSVSTWRTQSARNWRNAWHYGSNGNVVVQARARFENLHRLHFQLFIWLSICFFIKISLYVEHFTLTDSSFSTLQTHFG